MTQLHDLARKFPREVIADNPSGYGQYVPHHLYAQRLLLHLGAYSFELVEVLRGDTKEQENVVVGVVARLTVVVDGERMVIEDAGDCENPGNWPHDGARMKDAMSDALKRCCARVGLGLHLYAGDQYILARKLAERAEAERLEAEGPDPEGDTPEPEWDEDDPGRPFTDEAA